MEDDGVPDQSTQATSNTHTSRWATSTRQIILVSLIGFSCPGMLNALNGMGGGGNVDPTISAYASSALMATSAISYIVICVPFFEIFGVRSMSLGCWTYALYPLTLLVYAKTDNGKAVVVSGALLGVGSAFFWLVQGSIMISYPRPDQKGRAIAAFWIIFNLGGMIGALIAFVQTDQGSSDTGTISTGTYLFFVVIMLLGQGLTFLLVPPERVNRDDGTVVFAHEPSKQVSDFSQVVKKEIDSVIAIRHEKRVIFLVPMFFSANWFYSYQQNVMNGESFDLPGRTFCNSALYWAAQILGGLFIPLLCDLPPYPTRTRAILAWTFLFVFANITMLHGWSFELRREANPRGWIKFGDEQYKFGSSLYFAYGSLDALWQGLCYWLLGISCSTPLAAGKLVDIYKMTQAVGASIAYGLTTAGVSGQIQFWSNWVLIATSLLCALPAVLSATETSIVSEGEEGPTAEYRLLRDQN